MLKTPRLEDRAAPRPVRVLVVGKEPSDFFTAIAGYLNSQKDFTIDLLEFRDATRRDAAKVESGFGKIHEAPTFALSRPAMRDVQKAFLCAGAPLQLWQQLMRLVRSRGLLQGMKECARIAQSRAACERIFQSYDVVNVHYLDSTGAHFAQHLDASRGTVLSFWGSDLMQVGPGAHFEDQRHAVGNAQQITVQSHEMREIFLSKFGRQYADRVRLQLFTSDQAVVRAIDCGERESARQRFREHRGIGDDQVVVTIGHCAHPIDNHLEAIAALAALDGATRSRLTVVLPLTYLRSDQNYLAKVRSSVDRARFRSIVLEEFLSDDELVELRCGSDITVRVSKTDALSASLLEALYSGSIAILGAWLPYGRLYTSGAHSLPVVRLQDVGMKVREVIDDLEWHQELARKKAISVRGLVSLPQIAEEWGQMYAEVSQKARALT